MSESTALAKPRRAPRWVWITMILSLAINLLVIGGVLGAMWHFRYVRAFAEGGAPPHFGAFVATLPREKRTQIDVLLSEQREVLRPLRKAKNAARRAALEAIAADPFDKEIFRQLNNAYQEARQVVREKRNENFPEILALLSSDERSRLLKYRHKRWKRRHKYKGDHKNY